MMVHDWFDGWVETLIQTFPRKDWPAPGQPFWEAMSAAFVRAGVTHEVATKAAQQLLESGAFHHRDQFIPAVLAQAKAIFHARAPAETPDSRDAALAAAKDCTDCGGESGQTYRYWSVSQGKHITHGILFYCRCAMGRWVERQHRDKAPDMRRKSYDLADYPELWGEEYRDPAG